MLSIVVHVIEKLTTLGSKTIVVEVRKRRKSGDKSRQPIQSKTPHCNDTSAMVQRKGIQNCLWEFHKSSEEYPIVHCSEHNCIIVKNPKTGFISIMTYFAKGDHLQLIKVLKSHKLTD